MVTKKEAQEIAKNNRIKWLEQNKEKIEKRFNEVESSIETQVEDALLIIKEPQDRFRIVIYREKNEDNFILEEVIDILRKKLGKGGWLLELDLSDRNKIEATIK